MMRSQRTLSHLLTLLVPALALAGCITPVEGTVPPVPPMPPAGTPAAPAGVVAADHCAESGGVVETRFPYYDTGSANPPHLAGSHRFCVFTAADESRIWIATDTLYTDQPSLAVLAYLAMPSLGETSGGVNPSSVHCSDLGGLTSSAG